MPRSDIVNGFIADRHAEGCTVFDAIRKVRTTFKCSLMEAKRIVLAHWAYAPAPEVLAGAVEAIATGNLWLEFLCKDGTHCGLCGNTGIVETHPLTSAGVDCGFRGYCICPNGRAKKTQKWSLPGASSKG